VRKFKTSSYVSSTCCNLLIAIRKWMISPRSAHRNLGSSSQRVMATLFRRRAGNYVITASQRNIFAGGSVGWLKRGWWMEEWSSSRLQMSTTMSTHRRQWRQQHGRRIPMTFSAAVMTSLISLFLL